MDHVYDGIRVTCVAPGTIDSFYFTQLFGNSPDPTGLRKTLGGRQAMNRLAKPEKVASAMLCHASDEASFVTGTMLVGNGGWTAR